jgi:hypothetical protein
LEDGDRLMAKTIDAKTQDKLYNLSLPIEKTESGLSQFGDREKKR